MVLFALTTVAFASPDGDSLAERQFGVGIAVGAPSGVSGKMYLAADDTRLSDSIMAFQFTVGGDLGQVGDAAMCLDLIYQHEALNSIEDGYLVSPYFGAGLNFGANVMSKSFALGPRGIAGVTVVVPNMPVELYIESNPTIVVYDVISWSFDGAFGARYFF